MLLMSAPIASRIAASVVLASDASSAPYAGARFFRESQSQSGLLAEAPRPPHPGRTFWTTPERALILIKRRRRLEPAKACLDVYR